MTVVILMVDTKHVARFYGSCGHTIDNEVTPERFAELTAPRVVPTIVGDATVQNETTQEGDTRVVHIVPDRWTCCPACAGLD